ncbi:hypothetical protein [Aurantiacibacter sp. MUD61]|uniref:hypothetical protein n=1 Tax=Aurantiacibacter sp. MUD61 TaxID=3009083 RepID=UPI0022F0D2DB|nr:hypothetical protein [Aurantiacibacter sp. MUD61]
MGGFGSGRQYGQPTADASRKVDLAWMMRKGLAVEGRDLSGSIHFTCGDSPAGSISYRAEMKCEGRERMILSYTRGEGEDRESVEQIIPLTFTRPHFGGKRWWMICPYRGHRVGKLYLPLSGDRFASRKAWRLGYHSQRVNQRDRAFEALFRLQKRLGCTQGWEQPIRRPKGMHRRTYARLEEEYWRLDALCAVEMMRLIGLMRAK